MTAETSAINNRSLGQGWTANRDQIRLAQCVLFTAAAMVFGLALLLLVRRWSDALHKPLGSFSLIFLALALCGLATGARLLWHTAQRWQGQDHRRSYWLFDALLTASVLGLAAAVSLPESPVLATVILWLVVLGGESATWFVRLRRERTGTLSDPLVEDTAAQNAAVREAGSVVQQSDTALEAAADWPADDESSEILPEGVSQRITRGREESGGEMIFGIVRCDFAPGQRQQNVHIAFCPPLQRRPQLSMDQVDGPTARLRPAILEVFGAGVEVKLKAASTGPSSVQIQFYACEVLPSGSAA